MDKFADTISGFVCIRIVGGHFVRWYPDFQMYILKVYSVKLGIQILTFCDLYVDIIST